MPGGYIDPNFPTAQPPAPKGTPGSFQPSNYAQGYGGISQTAPPQQPHAQDPGGYGALPNAPLGEQQGYAPDPSFAGVSQPAPGFPDQQFDTQQPDPQHGYPPVYEDHAGHTHDQFGHPDSGHQQLEPVYEDDDEYEDDEPRSFSRMYLIGGVLVAAIAVGGGLAYAYKVLLGPAPNTGDAPVVLGSKDPTKTRPDQAGGRKFDHTDSKIMERLGDQGGDGTKRVPTVIVGRDGAIVPTQDANAANAGGASDGVVSVPGLTIVDGLGNNATAATSPPTQTDANKPIVVKPPSDDTETKPAQITNVAPTTNPVDTQPAVPKQPAATRSPPATTAATPKVTKPASSTTGAGGAAGYVAVLASVPVSNSSRMDALAQYADIQQKYGTLLQNKTPDVREANLGERGRYHRLLVGPPVSRAQASSLCNQLKSAGYSGCWVTAY